MCNFKEAEQALNEAFLPENIDNTMKLFEESEDKGGIKVTEFMDCLDSKVAESVSKRDETVKLVDGYIVALDLSKKETQDRFKAQVDKLKDFEIPDE